MIFSLVIKYDKLEIFYFSRTYNNLNPELDLLAIGAPYPQTQNILEILGL